MYVNIFYCISLSQTQCYLILGKAEISCCPAKGSN